MYLLPITELQRPNAAKRVLTLPIEDEATAERCNRVWDEGYRFTVERIADNELAFCIEGPHPRTGEPADLAITCIPDSIADIRDALPILIARLAQATKKDF